MSSMSQRNVKPAAAVAPVITTTTTTTMSQNPSSQQQAAAANQAPPSPVSNYTETHRNILQHFVRKGCMSQSELQKLKDRLVVENQRLYGENPQDKTINDFINAINHRIDFLSLRIMNIKLPQHPEEYYFGLINEDVDELSKHGTQFSQFQLTQFNEVLSLLTTNQKNNVTTSEFDVINAMQCKSVDDKHSLLEKLIDQHWLERIGDTICLGARTLADLKLYIERAFP